MQADYHIHTILCKHAEGEMEAYVQTAVEKGFDEIGFSDHAPVLDVYDQDHRMAWDLFPRYVDSVLALRESSPNIHIRLGIEADAYPGFESSLEKLLSNYPIDYVIGSVHFIDGEPLFNCPLPQLSGAEIESLLELYFARLKQSLQSGLFDVYAHLDVIKWHYSAWTPLIEKESQILLDEIAKRGKCIELNSSGLRKKPGEMYPSPNILKFACERGIPVIFGSDAHRPAETGAGHQEADALLRQIGYRKSARKINEFIAYEPHFSR